MMEDKLRQSFNEILLTSGNIFETINLTKSSNLVIPNNQLIHKTLIGKLNECLTKYDNVLDEFDLKLDDLNYSLKQLKENVRLEKQQKEQQDLLKQQQQEQQRQEELVKTESIFPSTDVTDAKMEIIEDFSDFLTDENNLNDFNLMDADMMMDDTPDLKQEIKTEIKPSIPTPIQIDTPMASNPATVPKIQTPNPADILSTINYGQTDDLTDGLMADDNFDVDRLLAGEGLDMTEDGEMMNEEDMNVFLDDLNLMLE